jgi:hypothetical protein
MRIYLRHQLPVPWSNQYLLRLEADGRWPKRFYLGERTPAWDADDCDAEVARRAAAQTKPSRPCRQVA